jgi:putative membrane protein
VNGLRFTVDINVSNHFAWYRTREALERTFMAWIRTAISLIGFGFTIVQFLQRVQEMGSPARVLHPQAPRDFGLALIGAGIAALAIATLQYQAQIHYLWQPDLRAIAGLDEHPHRTPAMFIAVLLMLIGIFAFVSVFFRF